MHFGSSYGMIWISTISWCRGSNPWTGLNPAFGRVRFWVLSLTQTEPKVRFRVRENWSRTGLNWTSATLLPSNTLSADGTIKTENFGALLAEFSKTIIDAINLNKRDRPPTSYSPTSNSQVTPEAKSRSCYVTWVHFMLSICRRYVAGTWPVHQVYIICEPGSVQGEPSSNRHKLSKKLYTKLIYTYICNIFCLWDKHPIYICPICGL